MVKIRKTLKEELLDIGWELELDDDLNIQVTSLETGELEEFNYLKDVKDFLKEKVNES